MQPCAGLEHLRSQIDRRIALARRHPPWTTSWWVLSHTPSAAIRRPEGRLRSSRLPTAATDLAPRAHRRARRPAQRPAGLRRARRVGQRRAKDAGQARPRQALDAALVDIEGSGARAAVPATGVGRGGDASAALPGAALTKPTGSRVPDGVHVDGHQGPRALSLTCAAPAPPRSPGSPATPPHPTPEGRPRQAPPGLQRPFTTSRPPPSRRSPRRRAPAPPPRPHPTRLRSGPPARGNSSVALGGHGYALSMPRRARTALIGAAVWGSPGRGLVRVPLHRRGQARRRLDPGGLRRPHPAAGEPRHQLHRGLCSPEPVRSSRRSRC